MSRDIWASGIHRRFPTATDRTPAVDTIRLGDAQFIYKITEIRLLFERIQQYNEQTEMLHHQPTFCSRILCLVLLLR